jgi:hypothetical protein
VRERLQARNNPKNGACLAQNLTLNIRLIIGPCRRRKPSSSIRKIRSPYDVAA